MTTKLGAVILFTCASLTGVALRMQQRTFAERVTRAPGSGGGAASLLAMAGAKAPPLR